MILTPQELTAVAGAVAYGIVAAVGCIIVVSRWLGKVSKNIDDVPTLLAMVTAVDKASAEALRKAGAAHERLDSQRETITLLRSEVDVLTERIGGHSDQVDQLGHQIMTRLADMQGLLNGLLGRELRRNHDEKEG